MKKGLLLFLCLLMFVSCSEDTDLEQLDNDKADFGLNTGTFDGSNLGTYKGVFSTYDSAERGSFVLNISKHGTSNAILDLVSGQSIHFRASSVIKENSEVDNVLFESKNGDAFKFSVKSNGGDPIFTDVKYNGLGSGMKAIKETSRGAVTTQTGTWTCDTGCSGSGTWNLMFVSGDGTGTYNNGSGGMVTQIIFNGSDIGGIGNQQNSCSTDVNIETCDIIGVTDPVGGNVAIWGGQHKYTTAGVGTDCSEASGTWSLPGRTGSWTSDVVCFNQGNFPFDPVPLSVDPEGSGCSGPGNVGIDIVDLTDSGISSSCGNGVADVWLSFTAASDGLTITVTTGGGAGSIPSFTVRNNPLLTQVACGGGGLSGPITITGLTPGNDYFLQVSANEDVAFCVEEFNDI